MQEPSTPRKILIADDDREHLLMLAFMLRKAGYQVVSAFDAKHALQLAVDQAPDLLLLDVHLGDQDAYSVQERLQKIDELASLPVIYITGDQSNWVQTTTDALGAFAVIRKPFNKEELLASVHAALCSADNIAASSAASTVPASCAAPPIQQYAEAYFG